MAFLNADWRDFESTPAAENKQKVAARIQNLDTGEIYTARLAITGNHQLYLPTEIQKMLKGAGRIRIQLL